MVGTYVPLGHIDFPDAVYTHDDPIEEDLLGPLMDTKVVLENAVQKLQGLASSLPRVGDSVVDHAQPTLKSPTHKINDNLEWLAYLTHEMDELTLGHQDMPANYCLVLVMPEIPEPLSEGQGLSILC